MKKYRYVLLDWDGNLAKTLDIWLEAFRVPLENRGIHKTDEEIAASFGAFTEYMQKWGITDTEAAYKEADEVGVKMLPNVELYPDALEVLEQLKARSVKTALITTSARENVVPVLEKYQLTHLFDVIVTYYDTDKHKPHAEPLEKALSDLGGVKNDAIMVGDTDKDLGAANNFGIDSALFFPAEHTKFYDLDALKTHNPTYVLHDFTELLDLVD